MVERVYAQNGTKTGVGGSSQATPPKLLDKDVIPLLACTQSSQLGQTRYVLAASLHISRNGLATGHLHSPVIPMLLCLA